MSSVNSVSTAPSSSCQNSIASSNSIAFSSSSSAAASYTRCQGLDLLVQAINFVDSSFFGVPFVQKRVLIRRRRRRAAAYAFSDFVVNELLNSGVVGGIESESGSEMETRHQPKQISMGNPIPKATTRQRRTMAMPLKYRDTVIEPWKR